MCTSVDGSHLTEADASSRAAATDLASAEQAGKEEPEDLPLRLLECISALIQSAIDVPQTTPYSCHRSHRERTLNRNAIVKLSIMISRHCDSV
jgi:hypothetical protein